jgi:molybdopterin-biosynthesis enzyme MoeA-like protein
MNRTIVFCAFFAILSACSNSGSKENDKEVESAIAANGTSEAELKESLKEIEKEEEELRKSLTSMTFDKLNFNFGKLIEDTENKVSYKVTNSGKNPLIIEKVDVSCGCTTAKKPEKPIAPGKSDIIEVIFHPKPGQLGEQKKTVTVTANTDPKIVVLNFEAFVEKK